MKSKIIPFVLGIAAAAAFYEATGLRLRGEPVEPHAAARSASVAAPGSSVPVSAKLTHESPPGAPPAPTGQPGNLAADLADAKARANFAELQLQAVEGQAIPWPDNVAPAFKRESVEQQLKEYVVDRGLGKLKSINCTEYPCVEVVQLNDSGPGASEALRTALSEMTKRYYDGQVTLGIQRTRVGNGSNSASYAGIGIAPHDADVRSRARYRAKLELDEYSE